MTTFEKKRKKKKPLPVYVNVHIVSIYTQRPEPFVWNAIFLFRTWSVNKILSPLTPVVLPCLLFPPFLFPLVSNLPRGSMTLSCAHFLSAGIFFHFREKWQVFSFFCPIFLLLSSPSFCFKSPVGPSLKWSLTSRFKSIRQR